MNKNRNGIGVVNNKQGQTVDKDKKPFLVRMKNGFGGWCRKHPKLVKTGKALGLISIGAAGTAATYEIIGRRGAHTDFSPAEVQETPFIPDPVVATVDTNQEE